MKSKKKRLPLETNNTQHHEIWRLGLIESKTLYFTEKRKLAGGVKIKAQYRISKLFLTFEANTSSSN